MLSSYDYVVIAVYFAFLLVIGAAFHRSNKSTSEFFRGGGKVLWWIVGATAFMTQFSAWTFTGAASKAYDNGFLVLAIYASNALAFFLNYLGAAPRLRRMRVITTFEGIRQRWSRGNEQFFTWIQLPIGILLAGIALNGLGVILSAVFGLNIQLTMLAAGLIVIFMAAFGGAWAATAGDFMQMLVLMAVTTAAAFLAIHHVGGVSGFLEKIPEGTLVWGNTGRESVVAFWILALIFGQAVTVNNLSDGYRYLCAKDDRHARKGALLATALFVVGPVLWFIPPMVGRIMFPDLSVVPALKQLGAHASEGAYLAVGIATMPKGMLGLMVTSLFAATISNMDTGLNKNTGIFIRSFYHPLFRPNASDRELMVVSRTATVGFGIMTILAGFMFHAMPGLSLFQLMQNFASLVSMPIAMPLLWGIFFKKTPPWSGWSTVVVCLFVSLLVGNLTTFFGPDAYERLLHLTPALAEWEHPTIIFSLGVFANITVGTLWFFGSAFWYNRQPAEYRGRVEEFFTRLKTPVSFEQEGGGADADASQYRTLGLLCTCYGGFIILLMLIPNPLTGRLAFLFVGGAIGGIGLMLLRRGRKDAAALLRRN
jgi:solute:Na+ symporter, SSS family